MGNERFSIVQAAAVSDERVSDSQFRTLAALGTFGDKAGWCFPKLKTLGAMLHKSPPAVSRDIHALEKLGYLQIKPQYKDNARINNLYRIIFDLPDPPLTPEVKTPLTPEVKAINAPSNAPENAPLAAPKPRGNPALYSIAVSLAEVCKMDFESNKGRLFVEAKLLSNATPAPTPELLKANYNGDPRAFWKAKDWRGKAGQPPTPQAIRETWAQATVTSGPTSKPQFTEAEKAAIKADLRRIREETK